MILAQLKSLRTRFLALIALGGSVVACGGMWITYTTTIRHFETQFVQQSILLAEILNHSATVADTPAQVQYVVDQLNLSAHVTNIVVALKEPARVMASSNQSWSGVSLDQLQDRHLSEHLLKSITQGKFGHHFDNGGDALILLIPLQPHLGNHKGLDESEVARDASSYGGVIMMVLDYKKASAANSEFLWLINTTLIAAVLIMMFIAYHFVNRQILDRLTVIRRAMIAQESGGNTMQLSVTANDEIGDLGRTFNNMISRFNTETERRANAAKELKDNEERFRSIIANSPTKIQIKDTEGRYVLINKVYEKLFGKTEKEILGKTALDIFPDNQTKLFMAHDQAVLDTGQTIERVEQREWADGTHTFLTVKFPIRGSDGKIKAIGSIGTDITERNAAEEKIMEAMKDAQIANKAKTEFLANMSHELRTPLNAVIGFSNILKDEILGPLGNTQYREYSCDIFDSGQHLLSLINDILDLSKIESGAGELYEEDVDIQETVHSVMKLLAGIADNGQVELVVDVPNDMPALRADARQLKQILVNLLSNAIKFTQTNGTVTLKAWSNAKSGYVFQVTDTGIGIAIENIPKALAPFQQIDGGLSRKRGGTGLGLPLTKSLVELHGGSLDLQSAIGVGTTVTVRFPAERIIIAPRGDETINTNVRKLG